VQPRTGISNFEIPQEGRDNVTEASGCEAEGHESNHGWCSARLDRGMGMDNHRVRWRLVAALDEGAMAANQWLVRAVLRHFGLSGNELVLKKIRGHDGLRLCSDWRSCSLFRRGENCFGSRKLI
jgi:hypothetical protein